LDLWQNPFCEQNGAQQGHPKLELQLPAPLPASTVSASVHSFPFQTLHDPFIGTKSGSDGGALFGRLEVAVQMYEEVMLLVVEF